MAETEIKKPRETDYTAGAALIKQLKEYWRTHPVKNDDEALWDIFRSADAKTWRNLMKAVAKLIEEGYEHPVWKPELCVETLRDLYQATKTPIWETVLSPSMKGKSHKYKTQIWKVARMSVEIAEKHCGD
jgi:hypothetical protein